MFQGNVRTILLVEDQAIIAMSEKAILERRGLRVQVAHHGERAVEIATTDPEIDLILMDIDLGSGIDGTEAATQILAVREIPIVFLTSHSEQEMVEKVKGITRYGYVLKNSGEFVLIEAIEMAFELFTAKRGVVEKEERFQYLFDFNHSCIAVMDAVDDGTDFVFVDYNRAAERADDIARERVIGNRVTEVFPGVAESGILGAFRAVWKNGESQAVRDAFYRDDRIEVWRDNYVYRLPGGEIVSVYQDTTQEKTLQSSLERAYATINSSDVIAITWKNEPGWPVEHVSENVTRILGYQPEELISGAIPYEPMIDPADLARVTAEIQRSGEDSTVSTIVHEPYRLTTKSGDTKWFDDRTVIRRGTDGEIVTFDGVLIDITERHVVMEDFALAKREIECLYEISRLVERDGIALPGILQGTVDLISQCNGDSHAIGFLLTVDGRECGTDARAGAEWTRAYPIVVEGTRRGELTATGHDAAGQWTAQRLETVERTLDAVTERLGRIIERYEQAEQFRRLFEESTQGIVYHVHDGTVVMANKAAERILGLSYGQLTGLTSLDPRWRAIHEDGSDYPGDTHPAMEALRTGEPVERKIMGVYHPEKDEYVWISTSAFPEFRSGETSPYRVFATFEDITATKKREIEQREHRLFVESILNAVDDSVAVIDSDMTILHANPGVQKLFEWDGQIIGNNYHDVFCRRVEQHDDAECLVQVTLETHRTERAERIIEFPDGRVKSYDVVAYPIVDERGAVNHVVEWCRDTTELRRQEREVQRYTQRLDQTMHAAEIAWWEVDLRDGSASFSDRTELLLGYAADRFRDYRDYTDLVHPADHERTLDSMREHLSGKTERYDVEYRIRTASGGYRWFHDVGSVIERDTAGEPTVVSGVVLDVSETKRTQEELRQNEEKHRLLFETMSPGVVFRNADGKIVSANPAAEKILGLSVDQVPGKSSDDSRWKLVDEQGNDVPEHERPSIRALRTGTRVGPVDRGVFIPEKNRYVWLSITAIPLSGMDHDAPHQVYTIFEDITERKKIERELVHQTELLNSIMDNMTDLVAITDQEGNFVFAGKSHELLGYDVASLVGRNVLDLVHPEDSAYLAEELNDFLHTGKGRTVEYRYRRADGTYVWLETSGKALTDNTDASRRFLFNSRNITERKYLEEQLRDSEQLARKKLEIVLEPESDLSGIELEDVIDVPAVQSLLESFQKITGLVGAIVDKTGKVLVGVGWQDMCTKFHRCHPETLRHCVESDTFLASGVAPGQFKSYLCKNGLHDLASPIHIDDRHMGNIYFGQFFYSDETLDRERFRGQARRFGFDEVAYLDALDKVPSYDRETVENVMTFYSQLAEMISSLGLNTVKLARALVKQQESESEIRKQLSEKEMLLKEVHHRIKNNVASIEAFLSIQADSTESVEAQDALRQAVTRVRSIRSLYEVLLIDENQREVSVKTYTDRIIESVLVVSRGIEYISIEKKITDFTISSQRIVPIGIVINELLTNIFKHAFKGRTGGHVSIQLDKVGTRVTLIIQDDGVGIVDATEEPKSPGFGLTIVGMIAGQLGGTYSVETNNGTRSVLEFGIAAD